MLGISLLLSFFPNPVFAGHMAGEYTLPYPSAMPGGFAYKISQVIEKINSYWYFGNLAQFEFHLRISDKYLVQSKTLFEYRQYLLAYNALLMSNEHYEKLQPYLKKAKKEGKDIKNYTIIVGNASHKHIEVLNALKNDTPSEFIWKPENASASHLPIHQELEKAITLRSKNI